MILVVREDGDRNWRKEGETRRQARTRRVDRETRNGRNVLAGAAVRRDWADRNGSLQSVETGSQRQATGCERTASGGMKCAERSGC